MKSPRSRKRSLISLAIYAGSLLLLGSVVCFCSRPKSGSLAVTGLTCEGLAEPLGIDTSVPRFSWRMTSGVPGDAQTAWQVQVSSSSYALEKGEADLWDSGEVASDESVLVQYEGKPLKSKDLCYWRVRVKDAKGKWSRWSDRARFSVGILDRREWEGEWIGRGEGASESDCPVFWKVFEAGKGETTFLHIASLGYHEIFLNGEKVGDKVLQPAVSQLDKRVLSVTYDLTPYLKEGENTLAVATGSGWFRSGTYGASHAGPLVLAEIGVLEPSGWRTVLKTDSRWNGCESGYEGLGTWRPGDFKGEKVVALKLPSGFTAASLALCESVPVNECDPGDILISPQMFRGDKIVERLGAVSVSREPEGLTVDFGKVVTGWLSVKIPRLPSGTELTFEYFDGKDSVGNLVSQREFDKYVCGGIDNEMFCNKFNHHAFRYVIVRGLPESAVLSDGVFEALRISECYGEKSSFSCSDTTLNRIHNLLKYTIECLSFDGYMVDCPHIERMGYGGDGNSSTLTFQTMFGVWDVYRNWLQAWADSQEENGDLPYVAPSPYMTGGGPYWCSFIIKAPWETYLQYRDKRILEECYPHMKKWLSFMETHVKEGLLRPIPASGKRNWYLGDWLAPEGVDYQDPISVNLINNCNLSESYALMSKIAYVLGDVEEGGRFSDKSKGLNDNIFHTFYNPESHTFGSGSQADLCYASLCGAVPDSLEEDIAGKLTAAVNPSLECGLVGIPLVTKWAVVNRKTQWMYDMLVHKGYPGYGYMLENGATAVWEDWKNPRSQVHNCFNGSGSWFYEALAGIRIDPENPGEVIIDPQMLDNVGWVNASRFFPEGEMSLRWEKSASGLNISISVPIGLKTRVRIPRETSEVEIDGRKRDLAMDREDAEYAPLVSGRHRIVFTENRL